jgi:hypothetical protein
VNSGVNVDFNNDGFPTPTATSTVHDVETYAPMNTDKDDPSARRPQQLPLPDDPIPNCDPQSPLKVFRASMRSFSIPTKLGVFSSGAVLPRPRGVLAAHAARPEGRRPSSPVYGSPGVPVGPGRSRA